MSDTPAQAPEVRRLKIVLLASSIVTLVFLGLAAFEENLFGEWREHQEAYRAALVERAETPEARATARLGAATRKLRPARIGVGRDARISRPGRNTCRALRVCQERATGADGATWAGNSTVASRRANAHR